MRSLRLLLVLALLCGGVLPSAIAAELVVHYHRPDADYDGWTLWTWDPDKNANQEVRQSGRDALGVIFRVNLDAYGGSPARLGMLPKFRNWDGKDDPDRTWTPAAGNEVYLVMADKVCHTTAPDLSPRVVTALVDAGDRVRLVLSKSLPRSEIDPAKVEIRDAAGRRIPVATAAPAEAGGSATRVVVATLGEAAFGEGNFAGSAAYEGYRTAPLRPGRIVDTFFDGRPLGTLIRSNRIYFRTFAPTASEVTVLVYDAAAGGEAQEFGMAARGNGIWQADAPATLVNRYYTLRATTPEGTFEVIDPYSRSNTAHNGRGVILDDRTPVAAGPTFPIKDAIIYEAHIRDFTIDPDAGIVHGGKYLGLAETGTRWRLDPTVRTGLDHLKELGVNTIQILPIQDFDNNEAAEGYNWGYMPFHFFSPDGWYATRRDDATRVAEVKRMIDALHREGFKVVLDVVNNHTAEGNPEVRVSFNGLAPNYYYRVKDDGSYSNGSGCGNEFRSESPMGRKFIIDSLLYWVNEMGVDGFRFDLMGLIDLETMKQVVAAIKAAKPDAFIYGEPWAAGATPIRVTSKGMQRGEGFGVFNDHFRDALRGSTFGSEPGYVAVGRDIPKVKKGILGSITDFALRADETINYIEAHDNHTLWDRIELVTRGRSDVTRDDRVRMDKLGAAILLTSQGIPFLQAGQEMLRTKDGEDNSYNAPDHVNMIHWSWKTENRDAFDYYRGLIALRQAHPMFRLGDPDEIKRSLFFLDDDLQLAVPGNGIGYVLNGNSSADAWRNALVLFNPEPRPLTFQVPAASWIPAVNGTIAGVAPLGAPVEGERITVAPRSAMVFYNEDPGFYGRVLEPRVAARAARAQVFSVAAPNASRVTVAGAFNGWNMDQHQLVRGADGTWSITIELDRGDYEYKFIADGDWDALNKDNRVIRVP